VKMSVVKKEFVLLDSQRSQKIVLSRFRLVFATVAGEVSMFRFQSEYSGRVLLQMSDC
jgi:hypothetical protein